MINKILKWLKDQTENYETWKKEQDRRKKQWEKNQKNEVPRSLEKLAEMFPLIRFIDKYNPLFVDPEDEGKTIRDQNTINYISSTHKELIKTLEENANLSRVGKTGRRIRPANTEEMERYHKKTEIQKEIRKVRNDNNLISSFDGIPEIKALHLKKMGANVGSRVIISSSNVIDPYFPEMVSIGNNTILGMGASIFCHEFIDGKLYVGEVEIGEDCLVGFGSIVLPGTKMEKNSVLTPGFLMSDLKENTMAKGLDGSIRIDKDHSKDLPKRDVKSLDFTLHNYLSKLIFPKDKPLKTAICNMSVEWQKSPLISQSIRQKLLILAGVEIGNNVIIENNVHFDTFYPEKITIGDGAVIKKGATIITHEGTVHNFRTGHVEIEENVVIESGAKVLPGVKIGKNSIIYPYAVVAQDVPANSELKR